MARRLGLLLIVLALASASLAGCIFRKPSGSSDDAETPAPSDPGAGDVGGGGSTTPDGGAGGAGGTGGTSGTGGTGGTGGSGSSTGGSGSSTGTKPVAPGSPRPSASSASAPVPALAVSHEETEERVAITLETVEGEVPYRDVTIRVGEDSYSFGADPATSPRRYAVDGASAATDALAEGDVLRVPASGRVAVALVHAPTGRALAAFEATVPDSTPPPAPQPASPPNGGSAKEDAKDEITLGWLPVSDAGPVRYEVQYDYDPLMAAAGGAEEIGGSALAIPAEFVPEASPIPGGGFLWWRVRAVDGAGNAGPWSDAWSLARGLPADAPALAQVSAAAGPGGARLTILSIASAIDAQDLAVRVGSEWFRFGLAPDYSALTFGIVPEKLPDAPLAPGDVLALPATGALEGALVDLTSGREIATFAQTIEDTLAPAVPVPLSPVTGDTATSPIALRWAASPDPSGTTYDVVVSSDPAWGLEAGLAGAYGLRDLSTLADVASLAFPAGLPVGAPKVVYWAVRAVDGAGNASEWSAPQSIELD